MDVTRARGLIAALADGINPITGEPLSPDDCCNQPEIIRALYCLMENTKDRQAKPLPENAGKPWSTQDDERLIELFDTGVGIDDISELFKRTKGAITSRLFRLGKIDYK